VDFYGCCFEENKPRHERLLAGLRPERPEVLSVLLLHGSMDDTLGARGKDAEMAAPFSSRELLEAGFDYTALGHYHRHIAIRDDNGWIRGAYGGIPVARSLDETAEHGILVGEISRGGVSPESLRVIHVDPRRILRITVPVDATVANSAAAAARIDAALATVGAGPEDIVVAALVGRTHPESGQFRFDPDWTGSRCFHLAIDQSALEPEHDIEALLADETSSRRVEGRFAERMRQLILEAGNSPRKAAQLRAAMAYGLDALNGREVKPRRVH
jgi:DNA repair exonuclease SbcCD nuclease subunit